MSKEFVVVRIGRYMLLRKENSEFSVRNIRNGNLEATYGINQKEEALKFLISLY